jgi:hypothetical protein
MDLYEETRDLKEMMIQWNSLRVTEAYRCVTFTAQQNEALARWREHDPHNNADEHFVEHRMARAATALAEVIELQERDDASFIACGQTLEAVAAMAPKEHKKSLSQVRRVCEGAVRQDMRYYATLASTYQHAVKELAEFIDERLDPETHG